MKKFIKEENNKLLNPIDYFNFYGSFVSIFEGVKDSTIKSETEVCLFNGDKDSLTQPTFVLKQYLVDVLLHNKFDLAIGCKLSKFMLLTAIKFKGDITASYNYVFYNIMKNEIPYIRVGTDYFKVIKKQDRYNGTNIIIKAWKKDEIKEDHTKEILKLIPKYDDFIIKPDNKEFHPVSNNCYNLYAKFSHDEFTGEVSINDIPTSLHLIRHIFGEQFNLGLQYIKLLYEYPMQILPILALASIERETGKTTFLNWIQMLFGENAIIINPHDLLSSFNDSYSTKNIIMIDETVIDKASVIEKIKSIATAKTMSVSQKYVSSYSVPFFGKLILCTNKEKDFMRIDEEEIRFWVRKVCKVNGEKNINIEVDLFNEIPKFLKFLTLLPCPDFSRSRMVFTNEEINTDSLQIIKDESKSGVRKELEILISDFFDNTDKDSFEATLIDIKNKWFLHNNQVSCHYIKTILNDQMKIMPQKMKKYYPFSEIDVISKTGTPYLFLRENSKLIEVQQIEEEIPF